jgi:hypothetical protein
MGIFSFKSENSIEQLYQRSGVALVQWLLRKHYEWYQTKIEKDIIEYLFIWMKPSVFISFTCTSKHIYTYNIKIILFISLPFRKFSQQ